MIFDFLKSFNFLSPIIRVRAARDDQEMINLLPNSTDPLSPLWKEFRGRWGGQTKADFETVRCYDSQHNLGFCNSTQAKRLIEAAANALDKIPIVSRVCLVKPVKII